MDNGTFSPSTRSFNDVLLLAPFTKENAGVYQCMAYNLQTKQQVTRRINISADSKNFAKQPTLDVSEHISIKLLSGRGNFTKRGTIALKCSIGEHYYDFMNFIIDSVSLILLNFLKAGGKQFKKSIEVIHFAQISFQVFPNIKQKHFFNSKKPENL